ncbi:hypothetical protein OXX69_006216, partial [Metschnikowia pulcherrima]
IMQLLRDNLTLWTDLSEAPAQQEEQEPQTSESKPEED